MSLSLFPPSFQVSNAVIGEDKSFNASRPFATADKLSVSVKLMPLLRKDVDVKSLQLERPHIELIRNARGEWNFATLGQESKPMPAQKTAPENASPQKTAEDTNKKNAGQIELANLGINDGQVAITDLQKHQ